jgi:hypothetical protein
VIGHSKHVSEIFAKYIAHCRHWHKPLQRRDAYLDHVHITNGSFVRVSQTGPPPPTHTYIHTHTQKKRNYTCTRTTAK